MSNAMDENGRESPMDSISPENVQNRSTSRLTMANIDNNIRYQTMVKRLHAKVTANRWMPQLTSSTACQGVLLKQSRGVYATKPEQVHPDLRAAAEAINVEVAFTMSTDTTDVIISTLEPFQTHIQFRDGSQMQILDSVADIASSASGSVRIHQYVALCRAERMILVWHDQLHQILQHAHDIDAKLLLHIWGNQLGMFSNRSSRRNSLMNNGLFVVPEKETKEPEVAEIEVVVQSKDEEAQDKDEPLERPRVFTSSIMVGMAMLLILVLVLGIGTSTLVSESLRDGQFLRLALLASIIGTIPLSVFFFIVIIGNIFQAIGPTGQLRSNSRFFSAVAPNLQKAFVQGFVPPEITIQMPVYVESLQETIMPTVRSLKAAISYYESRGGLARIFVNDDGMAYLDEKMVQERKDFYLDNNIGWVARPKHGEGFVRKGKFKKASNMNYGLNLSNKVEDLLQSKVDDFLRSNNTDLINSRIEHKLYNDARVEVLAQNPAAMCEGNIRVGEIILLVDSDTRVPEDCLIYGAAEMFLSPDVAIIQHATGVMQVAYDFFENGITFFTNMVYTSIRFSTGLGETAPFVGHNAFLRWQAIQGVSKENDEGYVEYWSESHVSEDFDMSLRLQIANNTTRLACYHGDGFKEGVSLTIYDEFARWEKYAYGCDELVFHPIYQWLYRGPFTKLFLKFIWSSYPLSSKITICGYIFSYYAIAASFPLTLANYFLIGWMNGYLDKFYLESWRIFLSIIVVFNILSNISLAIVRTRLGEKSFGSAILENFSWLPMFAIFFGGLSFHVNLAILAHLFGVDMQWSATSKEKIKSNFFKEVPMICKRFKWMYAIMIPCVGGMIYLATYAPLGWRIQGVTAVLPLAVSLGSHILAPLVLNPDLIIFYY